MTSGMPFVDLQAQRQRLGPQLDRAIARVLDHGAFILGPEVGELEAQLAKFCGAGHAVTCANGTDALQLVLMAEGIGPGDAVFVPAFTFAASAEVVALVGATPVFVDVQRDSFNMDPASLRDGIETARRLGLRPRCVMPVDLFGQPADYLALSPIAAEHDLLVLADAAQSFGARYHNQGVGSLGHYTATSFFPAKPLGCYGDGGAIFVNDGAKADLLRSLRFHGKGDDKYSNVRIGMNSRLDTIQAAILIEKLGIFSEEIARRQQAAGRYNAALADAVQIPRLADGVTSVWAQYTLVVEDRDAVATACKQAGVPTAVYYPVPLHRQTGYAQYPTATAALPVAEWLAARVISLPMHAYLAPPTQDRVIAAVRTGLGV
ncbi:MAG: DegT/DnrJ/EryC1/StrS aminotransferase family protein [Ferrovibrio sp.]